MWNGSFFESTSLKALGLRVQLGHTPGLQCHNPERCFDDNFTIIDTTGIHTISLDFCNCEQAPSHFQQLLRFAWFPATTSRPRTAATFRVLELFQLLSLESKISTNEFYNSLSRLMDNTRLVDLKVRTLFSGSVHSVTNNSRIGMKRSSGSPENGATSRCSSAQVEHMTLMV